MNTPTHALVNLTLLTRGRVRAGLLWILAGAVGPDVPIFVLFALARGLWRQPAARIWSATYFEPGWQLLIDLAHSVPLALALLLFGWRMRTAELRLLAWSLMLHSALDFPFHANDGHRHFFPVSDFRFDSPVSYWDPAHFGRAVALIETVSGFALSVYWFRRAVRAVARLMTALLAAVYAVGTALLVRSTIDFPWLARLLTGG
jgi:hypothetical protein